ncbi:hypothetical protein NXT3_PC00242 (plasmid) [Sinorhizobium fredii]|uniref:Uncharacterized protein n=1 Tax=Rhizobium fredii TaxID=380 RepID=A0A2L0HD38_RHIFR|nr:hypothetical protein NXT3_PC00242 [Sinorhizobium fredii]
MHQGSERFDRLRRDWYRLWVLVKPDAASPIISVTKASHLDDAVAALDLAWDDETRSQFELHHQTAPSPLADV